MLARRLFACALLLAACDSPEPVDAGVDSGPQGTDAGPLG